MALLGVGGPTCPKFRPTAPGRDQIGINRPLLVGEQNTNMLLFHVWFSERAQSR